MKQLMKAVAYWGERRESVGQCTERLMDFMENVREISPRLQHWSEGEVPVRYDADSLRAILEDGHNRDDTPQHKVIPELGFQIVWWGGQASGSDYRILKIRCGGYGEYSGLNNVIFRRLSTDWLNVDIAVELVRAMVSSWSPEHAAVCSKNALRAAGGAQIEAPIVDWVFFHRRPRTGALKAPSRVAFELDGGECIVVQDSPIRPDHLQDRARVRDLAKLLGVSPKPARQP